MFSVNVFQTEEKMASDFKTAIENQQLEEKFFYWFPYSVAAWIKLLESPAYKNGNRSLHLLRENARQITNLLPADVSALVSLGAGTGEKELELAPILQKQYPLLQYYPVDASFMLLEKATQAFFQKGIQGTGIKADFLDENWLADWRPSINGRIVLVILGNTLGFAPELIAEICHKSLLPGDVILVDGEFFDENSTLAGYDHPVNRNFAMGPLLSVGITEEMGELSFFTDESVDTPGLFRVGKQFQFNQDMEILLGGEKISVKKGEILKMSSSYKYSPERFEAFCHQIAQKELQKFISPDGKFALSVRIRA